MYNIRCTHCGKEIELVGPGDLKENYEMGPNHVTRLRSLGVFPMPVLALGNRNIYLKHDIDEYVKEDQRERLVRAAKSIGETTSGFSDEERKQILDLLANELSESGRKRG